MIILFLVTAALLSVRDATAVRNIPSSTPAKPGESNKRQGCENEHISCEEWANSGECTKNPGYMHSQCQKACGTCASAITSGGSGSHEVTSSDAIQQAIAFSNKGAKIMGTDEVGAARYFRKALKLAPNQLALLQLGRMGMNSPDASVKAKAYAHLERVFDEDCIPVPVDINSQQGYYLANLIARYHMKAYEGRASKKWLTLAASSSSRTNECSTMASAAYVSGYSESTEAAAAMFSEYHRGMDRLLSLPSLGMEQFNEDGDPFQYCLFSTFSQEVYLNEDLRNSTSKFYQLAVKAWPHFNYVAPHLLNEKKKKPKPSRDTRIRLGVASALFGPSSVTADFGETMARLSRKIFEVIYVDVRDSRPLDSPYLLKRASKGDQVVEIKLAYDEKDWLDEARKSIAALDLDILLYLDLTMSNKIQRLAMSRLATVQATSHGHPVTSGIDKSVMNFFVSWGAAELPLEEAKTHYTEELMMLPADSLHQYYKPLISKSGVSSVTGMPFAQFDRKVLARDFKIPAEDNWYLCMQKPFKRHPLFDDLIAGVLANDSKGLVLLHDLYIESEEHREIIHDRLVRAGVDMNRVHFIPTLPHHVLMAFYKESDVVLDSYLAGGCTTTREAIEVGAAVVTLPANYLGGRWSLAYFMQIGVLDTVAKDTADYVRIAVKFGTDKTEQARVRNLIKANAKKLFHRSEAVSAWTHLLQEMAYNGTELGKRTDHSAKLSDIKETNLDWNGISKGASGATIKPSVLTGDAKLDWEDAFATAGYPKNSKVDKNDVLTCKFVTVPLADGEVKLAEIEKLWATTIGRKALIDQEEFGLFWHAFDALFDEEGDDDVHEERNSNLVSDEL